ncbi:S8 family peptidase [Ensifer adhaerens]|uniref:S8 family peptidase n=1 Tax=Ensifer adhaerens TaxID=106592 RepID=UPI0015EB57C7|nr:S8 family peptidase [Ensifer adhaerens]
MARLPHLYARDIGIASQQFRAVGRGGGKEPKPVDNRRKHARKLRSDLEQVVSQLDEIRKEQASIKIPLKQRGMAIAIESREDNPLFVSATSRSTTQGLKLLTLQVNPVDPQLNAQFNHDLANFFVTRDTFKSLLTALGKYENWTGAGDDLDKLFADDDSANSRRPSNFKLFESAAAIRLANLRDFWTDDIGKFPRRRGETTWEVWTRLDYEDAFQKALGALEIETDGRVTEFVETAVRNVRATPEEMQHLIRKSGAVAELRSASAFASDYMSASPDGQQGMITSLAQRLVAAPRGAPRIAILDTGVNPTNELLTASLPRARCYTVSDDWDISDHEGHGTKMAGVALFGDLETIPSGTAPIQLSASLESVVVAAPHGSEDVPAHDAIQKAVELVERQEAQRVFCLAQTAVGESEDGRPTSTSAALDKLVYADGKDSRLFCVAVGNVEHSSTEPYQIVDYIERNRRHGIQSPAQSLNALSIGAFTNKLNGKRPLVAPIGDLSPTSRTAQEWVARAARKPDIVMEGGNFEVDPDGLFSRPSPRNLVLTTSRMAPRNPLAMTGQTSAATAAAANLAARLMARYPQFRMETVRGLLVHSAEWTPAMLDQLRALQQSQLTNDPWGTLLSRYGWGTPDEQRLFTSSESAMTLIVEDSLRPYELGDSNQVRLREMKYFKLPWPTAALTALNQTEVEMRCTLSYFVEPDPHAIARNRYDRYPSHRLKFDLRRFGESDIKAQSRFNALEEDDDSFGGMDDGWIAGKRLSGNGTLQHDIWRGPAYKLAERDGISVAPVKGWWADIRRSERYRRRIRFSLIVSIRVPEGAANIYQPVNAAVRAIVPV